MLTDLYLDQKWASSLEGQVVAIADEIAQRGHDIDDAISSNLITVEELLQGLYLPKFSAVHQSLLKEKKLLEENRRIYINPQELMKGRIVSCIVGFFIHDIIINSNGTDLYQYKNDEGKFEELLIKFSKSGKALCDFLEKLINKKVINNAEVARFDYNADIIIRKLFLSYYQKPQLLHEGTLKRIYSDMLYHSDDRVADCAIDIRNGNLEVVKSEIIEFNKENIDLEQLSKDEEYIRLEKRRILVRNIVDYIAGMTDSYALSEYNKIK